MMGVAKPVRSAIVVEICATAAAAPVQARARDASSRAAAIESTTWVHGQNAGAPDATQLSLGISEALINTAGGLAAAIVAIIAYNYFTTKVDGISQTTDEASAALMHALGLRAAAHARAQRHVGAVEAAPGITG